MTCIAKRTRRVRYAVVSLVVLVLGSSTAASSRTHSPGAQQLVNLRLQESFTPSEQYIPEAVAIKEGFFKRLGLNVTVQPGTGGATSAAVVAQGSSPIGVAGASDVLVSRDKGVNVEAVATSIPHDPSALISLASNPIRSAGDIRGKRIGIVPGSSSYTLLQAVLRTNDIDIQKDVTIVVLSVSDITTALISHSVDAIAVFTSTNVPALIQQGQTPFVLKFSALGVDVPGNVYIANPAFAAKSPRIVARFIQGIERGYRYVQQHGIAAGIKDLNALYPELVSQNTLLTQRYKYELASGYLPYVSRKKISLKNFGFARTRLEALNAWLLATGSIKRPGQISAAFPPIFVKLATSA